MKMTKLFYLSVSISIVLVMSILIGGQALSMLLSNSHLIPRQLSRR